MIKPDIHIKSVKLRRCPFCGSFDVRLVEHRNELIVVDRFYSIACPDCGADIYFYGSETRATETMDKYDRRSSE